MNLSSALIALSLLISSTFAAELPWPADSIRQENVPKGTITQHEISSNIFANTRRQYYIYVPAQYDPAKPASVMVFQDGHNYVNQKGDFRTPIVLDNLIHKKQIPVTIAIFVNPGLKVDKIEGKQDWGTQKKKSNRSFEYDSLTPDYATFLEKELLPAVAKNYNLTQDPDQRAICGLSSGGICAFTVAWERPDLFRKVISHIGSFTNIRGGHVYPALIRKEKVRPLRIYLQDGKDDLNNAHGNWWLSNLQMQSALAFRKYDHYWAPTDGGHSGKHAGKIFPEALKWIWRK
ncbi:MAG: alpha/beta hydrolase [Akkermansiaceae bacterium]